MAARLRHRGGASWKDRRAKKPVATRVLPVLAPGYAGLTVRGRF
jgi:hypothetical protein